MRVGVLLAALFIYLNVLYHEVVEVRGQFNIRVGFQREETATSSPYGRGAGGGGLYYGDLRNARRTTTTLSPTVDYEYWKRTHSTASRSTKKPSKFKRWLMNLTNIGYDKYEPPKKHEKSTVAIAVSMMIIRVHSLSDSAMDYGLELYYRERWNDYRLRFNPSEYGKAEELNLPIVSVNHVWKPDTYFVNALSAEVDSENSVTHKAFFRLRHNGDIFYSRKISLKADCPMDLTMYPFDVQSCKLKLESYSNPRQDVSYRWVDGNSKDIEFKDRIELAEFVAETYKTSSKITNYTTGRFDSLELCLTFKRRAGFCIMQVFFPATAVVMSSWVALWLAEDTTFSDVLAVILAIIFLAYAYNSVMPRVSYVKLLDLYMCSCFLFVFLSLAKLVIIKYFCHKWAKQNNRSYDFFFDQLLRMDGASSNSVDVEQAAATTTDNTNSVDSPKQQDNKKLKAVVNGTTTTNNRSSRILNGKNSPRDQQKHHRNGTCFLETNEAIPISKSMESSTDREEDYHSAVYPAEVTASENLKNEEIEANRVLEYDETRLLNENGEAIELGAPAVTNNRIAASDHNPLARLFGNFGSSFVNSAFGGAGAGTDGGRKVTFFGMEAFAAWFEQRKKKSGAARCLKYLRYFHVFTQLALPLAFGSFFVFLLLIYPNVRRPSNC